MALYYDTSYEGEFPLYNYYHTTFNKVPCSKVFDNSIKDSILKYLRKEGFEIIFTSEKVNKEGTEYISSRIFQKDDILVRVRAENLDDSSKNFDQIDPEDLFLGVELDEYKGFINMKAFYVEVLYHKRNEILLELTDFCKKNYYKTKKGKKISLVIDNGRGFETKKIKIPEIKIDLPLNYGTSFMPVYNRIVERLSYEDGKGLVLLHGVPGTGKTSFIKHLINVIEKDIIFIPTHMVESISSPSFIPFLIDRPNSILVIEDAERVLLNRETQQSSSSGVSNILNLTDGSLDILSIQIIATFNTPKNNIDPALLRKGRLIAEWEFKELSVENSNALLNNMFPDKNYITNKSMTLTDIYNFEEEQYKVQNERTQIGFRNNKY